MLLLLSLALATLFIFAVLALPIGAYLTDRLEVTKQKSATTAIALSIITGFAFSAVAASWSYGVFDIDLYPVFMALLGLLTWISFGVKRKLGALRILKSGWNKSDLLLLLPILFSVYLTRGQWSGAFGATLRAGDGPDTSQNLMAAQSARVIGNNWATQADYYLDYVNKPGLRSAVMELYRLPSFREQAGIDYLVYGTRWGLTVPYSQVLRFFGNSAVLWETGFVLTISLLCICIITYATVRSFAQSNLMPAIASLAVVGNTPFLLQYFNGGLAQGWALVGTSGMFLALLIYFSSNPTERVKDERKHIAIFTIAWLAMTITYIDAAIVMALFAVVLVLVLLVFARNRVMGFLRVFLFSGLSAAFLVPAFTYASLLTFDFRIKAATGTGLPSQIWPLPSEILGFVDIFTNASATRTSETLLIAIVITAYFIYKLVQGQFTLKNLAWLSHLGTAGLIVVGVGYILSVTGKLGTNYIYLKVATYVAPLLIMALFLLLDGTKSALGKSKFQWNLVVPVFLMGIALLSSYNATENLKNQGTNIPDDFKVFLDDEVLQEEMSKYNYLIPYMVSSNFFGVLGDTNWVSKAPNDLILDRRLDRELRLMCFSADTSCKPNTERIPNPKLENFGILIFKSPITIEEFAKLTPRERFDANFLAFGQEPQVIPERFIGGNPYYN